MRAKERATLNVSDTHGILLRPEHDIIASSDALDWRSMYASHQRERPYEGKFPANNHHLLIIHLNGPVRVRRELSGERCEAKVGAGGLFVLPPGCDFGVALLASLESVHLYVHRDLISAAAQELCHGDPDRMEFIPRIGEHDPLLEQLGRNVQHASGAAERFICR